MRKLDEKWEGEIYFGIVPVKYLYGDDSEIWLVRAQDIEKLPFGDFWSDKSRGSTCLRESEAPFSNLMYLHDWHKFCEIFIKTGR